MQQDEGPALIKSRPGTKASDSVLVKPERNYPMRVGYLVDAHNTLTGKREQFAIPHGRFFAAVRQLPTLRAKGFTDIKITNAA